MGLTRSVLLSVRGLSLAFRSRDASGATVMSPVLDRVSFDLAAGETLGLVGESGSGKSVTALAVMGLLDPAANVSGGQVLLDGTDLLLADERRMRALRGSTLALVFQNPARALNPLRPVGRQIEDVLRAHGRITAREARASALVMLDDVGIPSPAERARAYPFELSGGTCQRVMIALVLAARPRLLIADEPTTGLDVITQALILDLLAELARERGMATLLITHDLALAAERCQRIAVMHAGQMAETAPAGRLVTQPRHPYTQALLRATPRPGLRLADLAAIPGGAPELWRHDLPACRFFNRCDRRTAICRASRPPLVAVATGHDVACHHPA